MSDTLPFQLLFHGACLTFFIYSFFSKNSFLFRNEKKCINIEADDELFIPSKQSSEAAGYDLYATEDGSILPNDRKLIDTGIKLQIPIGYYGRIAPRSSLALKYGIDVGAGVIDSDYRGKIKVILFNHSREKFIYKKFDRIAQIIITKIGDFELYENNLNITIRNEGGFGSTNFIANEYSNGSKKRKIQKYNEEEISSEEEISCEEISSEEEMSSEEDNENVSEEDNEEDIDEEKTQDVSEEDNEEDVDEEKTQDVIEEDKQEKITDEKITEEKIENDWWQFSKSE